VPLPVSLLSSLNSRICQSKRILRNYKLSCVSLKHNATPFNTTHRNTPHQVSEGLRMADMWNCACIYVPVYILCISLSILVCTVQRNVPVCITQPQALAVLAHAGQYQQTVARALNERGAVAVTMENCSRCGFPVIEERPMHAHTGKIGQNSTKVSHIGQQRHHMSLM